MSLSSRARHSFSQWDWLSMLDLRRVTSILRSCDCIQAQNTQSILIFLVCQRQLTHLSISSNCSSWLTCLLVDVFSYLCQLAYNNYVWLRALSETIKADAESASAEADTIDLLHCSWLVWHSICTQLLIKCHLLHSNRQISLWQMSNQSPLFFGNDAHLDRHPRQRRARATFWPDWIRRRWRARTVRIDHWIRLWRHHQREHVSARTSATKSAYVKFRRRLIEIKSKASARKLTLRRQFFKMRKWRKWEADADALDRFDQLFIHYFDVFSLKSYFRTINFHLMLGLWLKLLTCRFSDWGTLRF